MKIEALGHVVIRVRDLARAEAFYHGLLGIPISARAPMSLYCDDPDDNRVAWRDDPALILSEGGPISLS